MMHLTLEFSQLIGQKVLIKSFLTISCSLKPQYNVKEPFLKYIFLTFYIILPNYKMIKKITFYYQFLFTRGIFFFTKSCTEMKAHILTNRYYHKLCDTEHKRFMNISFT